jgi:hypothetical protein
MAAKPMIITANTERGQASGLRPSALAHSQKAAKRQGGTNKNQNGHCKRQQSI